MKKMKFFALTFSAFVLAPKIVFGAINTFRDLMQSFVVILGNGMAVLYTAGFAGFFWGISLFVLNRDDASKREEGKKWMLWSVIALFAMIVAWGLVSILVNTFGLSITVIPQL